MSCQIKRHGAGTIVPVLVVEATLTMPAIFMLVVAVITRFVKVLTIYRARGKSPEDASYHYRQNGVASMNLRDEIMGCEPRN